MERKNYTVAIDLGSSSVVVAVGEKTAEGLLDVVCAVSKPVEGVHAGKIENIEIVGGRENMIITDEQLAEYVGAIIASQSADVDIVSGATVDCQAIGTAIGQAFAK